MRDFEASFLRLVDKITNGCHIEINDTGTKMRYKPGMIIGGSELEHDCGKTRGIGWFLEGLIMLAPFGKQPLSIRLKGITNEETSLCVDYMRTVTLPLLRHFGISEGLELRVVKRGARPDGGGEVVFRCPNVKALKPVNLTEIGCVRRVRGVAYASKVSRELSAPSRNMHITNCCHTNVSSPPAQIPNRVVDAAKGLLNKVLPDVYVYTDHQKGASAGASAGYGVSLVAETTNGCLFGSEACGGAGQLPEDVGLVAAKLLLEEVQNGGCVDSANQGLILTLAVLCPEDVSRIRLGRLTPSTVKLLRLLRDMFGVIFKIKPDEKSMTILLSCLGAGFKNVAKGIA